MASQGELEDEKYNLPADRYMDVTSRHKENAQPGDASDSSSGTYPRNP